MGDGINDAAAIKEADVGISVDTGADIAKESADIILLEKDLMVLRSGVIYGRRTFGNIIKYIKMTASSNFGNMFSMIGASAFYLSYLCFRYKYLPRICFMMFHNLLFRGILWIRIFWKNLKMGCQQYQEIYVVYRSFKFYFRLYNFCGNVLYLQGQYSGTSEPISDRMVCRRFIISDFDCAYYQDKENTVYPKLGSSSGSCTYQSDYAYGGFHSVYSDSRISENAATTIILFPLSSGNSYRILYPDSVCKTMVYPEIPAMVIKVN